MNTHTIILVPLILIGVLGGVWYWFAQAPATPAAPTDYKNATYRIEGQTVALVDGHAESPVAPGSASMVVTQYFGNEATGDLNGDGVADTVFLLTQSTGGSGTFYYVVGAVKTVAGYEGTGAVLLGDRIAPQTTMIADGKVTVNYADRATGEPMTTAPSLGKSLTLKLDPTTLQFGIVVQDFEGEADPNRMTLTMQTWRWIETLYSDDTKVTPATQKFTLTFKDDKTFSATTDCNGVGGDYVVDGATITFSKMISTLMFCEGSQEQDFTKMLSQAQGYHFTSKGELIFDLKLDTGTMIFK